jgi:hypothetical protein
MLFFQNTQTQISPCIASKAKFALGLKNERSFNTKSCSQAYWTRTIDTLCSINEIISNTRRQTAIDRYEEFINN